MEDITKKLIDFCDDKPEFEEICACLRGDSSNLPPGTYMCDPDAYNRLVNRFSEELMNAPEETIPMVISAFANDWMSPQFWENKFVTKNDIKYYIECDTGYIKEKNQNNKKLFTSLDPVCTGLVTGAIAELMASFNCEESANRVFNEVHFYTDGDPNLTIGFGNFASGNVTNLFSYMDDDTKKTSLSKKDQELGKSAKERLIQYVAFRLSLNKTYLEQFIGDELIKKEIDKGKWSPSSIDSIDSSTLYEMVSFFFSKDGALNSDYKGKSHYKKDKEGFAIVSGLAYWADQAIYNNNNERKNLFPKGEKESNFWFNDIMGVKQTIEDKLYYPALCLKEVALWQIIFWVLVKELNTAKITAASKNLDTHYGAVAALTSWKSTGYDYGDEAVTKCIGSIDINTPEGKHKAALKFWEHYNEKRLDEKLKKTKKKINKLEEKKKKEGLKEKEDEDLVKLKKEEPVIELIITKRKINELEEKKEKEGLTEKENKDLVELKKEEAEIIEERLKLNEKLEKTKKKINELEEKKEKEGLTEKENKDLVKLKKAKAEVEELLNAGKSIPKKYIRARQKSIFSKWLQTQQQTFGNIVFTLGVDMDSKLNY